MGTTEVLPGVVNHEMFACGTVVQKYQGWPPGVDSAL